MLTSVESPTSPRDMANPRVDVPRQPPARRHVRFSVTSLLTVTPPLTDEELGVLWYSPQEQEQHKTLLLSQVRRLARRLATTPMTDIRKEELYDCVGNETFLSPDILRSTARHKAGHLKAVLSAQAGRHGAEEVARRARESSAPAIARAHKVASGYWEALK